MTAIKINDGSNGLTTVLFIFTGPTVGQQKNS